MNASLKHLALLATGWFACLASALATGTLTGRVSDANGQPLPSATVTTDDGKGAFADMDGNYTLTLAAGEHRVTFSFIGYLSKTETVAVREGETATMNVRLTEDAVMLNESVVVGYGVQRKKEVTGAISTINSKEITAVRTPSFEAALQGQAAGVQVTQGSGMAGSGSIIRVRGLSSISAGGDPLYVIDGIPITQDYFLGGNQGAMNRNPLASLNPNDIADIQILKDAAATGIYGSRGANGVILITTKRGTKQGVKVSYSSSLGYGEPSSRPNMMTTEEYLTIRQEAWENDGGTGYVWLPYMSTANDSPEARRLAYEEALKTNTDWFDLMTRRAQKTQQNISFRSGGKWWSMYNGLSYDKNESYAVGNSYTRTTLRTNLTLKPLDGLQLDVQANTSKGVNQRVDGGWSGGIGASMSTALPYMSPYVLDTLFDDDGNVSEVVRDYELNRWWNPYVSLVSQNRLWRETETRNFLTGQLTYSPTSRVDVVLTGGVDQSIVVEDNWRGEVLNQNDVNAGQGIPNHGVDFDAAPRGQFARLGHSDLARIEGPHVPSHLGRPHSVSALSIARQVQRTWGPNGQLGGHEDVGACAVHRFVLRIPDVPRVAHAPKFAPTGLPCTCENQKTCCRLAAAAARPGRFARNAFPRPAS